MSGFIGLKLQSHSDMLRRELPTIREVSIRIFQTIIIINKHCVSIVLNALISMLEFSIIKERRIIISVFKINNVQLKIK